MDWERDSISIAETSTLERQNYPGVAENSGNPIPRNQESLESGGLTRLS